MTRRAKAQAELPVNLQSATNLANDLETTSARDYVGYRLVNELVKPLTVDELQDGDYLIDPSHLSEFREAVTPQEFEERERRAKRKKRRGVGIVSLFPLALIAYGALELTGNGPLWHMMVSGSDSILPGMAAALIPFLIGAGVAGTCFMATESYTNKIDESEIKRIPDLRMTELRRLVGTPYDLNTPSYEELYRAVSLMNDVKDLSRSRTATREKIEGLRMARKTPEVLKLQKDLQAKLKALGSQIPELEDEIGKILASNGEAKNTVAERTVEHG